MTEEAAKKTKTPKTKKVGPDKATKAARTFANKVNALTRHIQAIANRNAKRRKKGKEEINPDNAAAVALSKLEKKGSVTARKTPHSEKWTRRTKVLANQHRLAGYKGNGVLRFGQPGVSVYDGMKPYHKRECEKLTKVFMARLQKVKESKDEELKREKNEKLAREATQRRRIEEEKKKLGKGKSKAPSKPKAKAEVKPVAKAEQPAPKKKATGKQKP